MRPFLTRAFRFGLLFLVATSVNTIAWDVLINGRLYNCTDPIGFDYLHRGDWVHAWEGHPIQTVAHVFRDGDMPGWLSGLGRRGDASAMIDLL